MYVYQYPSSQSIATAKLFSTDYTANKKTRWNQFTDISKCRQKTTFQPTARHLLQAQRAYRTKTAPNFPDKPFCHRLPAIAAQVEGQRCNARRAEWQPRGNRLKITTVSSVPGTSPSVFLHGRRWADTARNAPTLPRTTIATVYILQHWRFWHNDVQHLLRAVRYFANPQKQKAGRRRLWWCCLPKADRERRVPVFTVDCGAVDLKCGEAKKVHISACNRDRLPHPQLSTASPPQKTPW